MKTQPKDSRELPSLRSIMEVYFHGLSYAVSFCSQVRAGVLVKDIRGWTINEDAIGLLWSDLTSVLREIAESPPFSPIHRDSPHRFLKKAIKHYKLRLSNGDTSWGKIGWTIENGVRIVRIRFRPEPKFMPFEEVLEAIERHAGIAGLDSKEILFRYRGFLIYDPEELVNHILPERADLAMVKGMLNRHSETVFDKIDSVGTAMFVPVPRDSNGLRYLPHKNGSVARIKPIRICRQNSSDSNSGDNNYRRTEPRPFSKGELVFYPNHVELCGVKILGDTGLGHSRRILDMLREKRRGRFVRMSGEQLAREIMESIGASVDVGIGTITGCAKTIRTNIRKRLKRELNFVCEVNDVLVRDDQGYHLNDEKITVRNGGDDSGDVPSNVPGDICHDPDVPVDVPGEMDGLNERQEWILEQLRGCNEIARKRLEENFGISSKTAKRDLSDLVKRDLIEYVRKPHPGFYRRKT